jgi:hypothetical protein
VQKTTPTTSRIEAIRDDDLGTDTFIHLLAIAVSLRLFFLYYGAFFAPAHLASCAYKIPILAEELRIWHSRKEKIHTEHQPELCPLKDSCRLNSSIVAFGIICIVWYYVLS